MYTKREIRKVLRRQLRQYEASIGALTPDERRALHEWVADGNSVYDNPFGIADEDSRPSCYISAIRLISDMLSYSEDYGFWTGGENGNFKPVKNCFKEKESCFDNAYI